MAIRFCDYTFDPVTGELFRDGMAVRLPHKAIEVLTVLVSHQGELVTRTDLQAALWPSNTFVDFDNNLNAAIRKLRAVLGDQASAPSFIETLPKRGYRFLPRVEADVTAPGAVAEAAVDDAADCERRPRTRLDWRWATVTVVIALVASAALILRGNAMHPDVAVISVLPFINVSGDAEQKHISDGLTAELTTQLAMYRRYRVVAGGPGDSTPLLKSADFVVEGSTRLDSSGLFVTARVVRTEGGDHVWAGVFQCPQGDTAAIQRQLALKIATALQQQPADANHSDNRNGRPPEFISN